MGRGGPQPAFQVRPLESLSRDDNGVEEVPNVENIWNMSGGPGTFGGAIDDTGEDSEEEKKEDDGVDDDETEKEENEIDKEEDDDEEDGKRLGCLDERELAEPYVTDHNNSAKEKKKVKFENLPSDSESEQRKGRYYKEEDDDKERSEPAPSVEDFRPTPRLASFGRKLPQAAGCDNQEVHLYEGGEESSQLEEERPVALNGTRDTGSVENESQKCHTRLCPIGEGELDAGNDDEDENEKKRIGNGGDEHYPLFNEAENEQYVVDVVDDIDNDGEDQGTEEEEVVFEGQEVSLKIDEMEFEEECIQLVISHGQVVTAQCLGARKEVKPVPQEPLEDDTHATHQTQRTDPSLYDEMDNTTAPDFTSAMLGSTGRMSGLEGLEDDTLAGGARWDQVQNQTLTLVTEESSHSSLQSLHLETQQKSLLELPRDSQSNIPHIEAKSDGIYTAGDNKGQEEREKAQVNHHVNNFKSCVSDNGVEKAGSKNKKGSGMSTHVGNSSMQAGCGRDNDQGAYTKRQEEKMDPDGFSSKLLSGTGSEGSDFVEVISKSMLRCSREVNDINELKSSGNDVWPGSEGLLSQSGSLKNEFELEVKGSRPRNIPSDSKYDHPKKMSISCEKIDSDNVMNDGLGVITLPLDADGSTACTQMDFNGKWSYQDTIKTTDSVSDPSMLETYENISNRSLDTTVTLKSESAQVTLASDSGQHVFETSISMPVKNAQEGKRNSSRKVSFDLATYKENGFSATQSTSSANDISVVSHSAQRSWDCGDNMEPHNILMKNTDESPQTTDMQRAGELFKDDSYISDTGDVDVTMISNSAQAGTDQLTPEADNTDVSETFESRSSNIGQMKPALKQSVIRRGESSLSQTQMSETNASDVTMISESAQVEENMQSQTPQSSTQKEMTQSQSQTSKTSAFDITMMSNSVQAGNNSVLDRIVTDTLTPENALTEKVHMLVRNETKQPEGLHISALEERNSLSFSQTQISKTSPEDVTMMSQSVQADTDAISNESIALDATMISESAQIGTGHVRFDQEETVTSQTLQSVAFGDQKMSLSQTHSGKISAADVTMVSHSVQVGTDSILSEPDGTLCSRAAPAPVRHESPHEKAKRKDESAAISSYTERPSTTSNVMGVSRSIQVSLLSTDRTTASSDVLMMSRSVQGTSMSCSKMESEFIGDEHESCDDLVSRGAHGSLQNAVAQSRTSAIDVTMISDSLQVGSAFRCDERSWIDDVAVATAGLSPQRNDMNLRTQITKDITSTIVSMVSDQRLLTDYDNEAPSFGMSKSHLETATTKKTDSSTEMLSNTTEMMRTDGNVFKQAMSSLGTGRPYQGIETESGTMLQDGPRPPPQMEVKRKTPREKSLTREHEELEENSEANHHSWPGTGTEKSRTMFSVAGKSGSARLNHGPEASYQLTNRIPLKASDDTQARKKPTKRLIGINAASAKDPSRTHLSRRSAKKALPDIKLSVRAPPEPWTWDESKTMFGRGDDSLGRSALRQEIPHKPLSLMSRAEALVYQVHGSKPAQTDAESSAGRREGAMGFGEEERYFAHGEAESSEASPSAELEDAHSRDSADDATAASRGGSTEEILQRPGALESARRKSTAQPGVSDGKGKRSRARPTGLKDMAGKSRGKQTTTKIRTEPNKKLCTAKSGQQKKSKISGSGGANRSKPKKGGFKKSQKKKKKLEADDDGEVKTPKEEDGKKGLGEDETRESDEGGESSLSGTETEAGGDRDRDGGGPGSGGSRVMNRKRISRAMLFPPKVQCDGYFLPESNVVSVVVKTINCDLDRDDVGVKVQIHRPSQEVKERKTLRPRPTLQADRPWGVFKRPVMNRDKHILASNILDLRAANAPFNTSLDEEASRRHQAMFGHWPVL